MSKHTKTGLGGLLLAGAIAVCSPNPAGAQPVTTYHVTADVSARSTPTAAPTAVYGIPKGSQFGVECQTIGEPVGPNGNTLYFWSDYAGRQFFIPDTYTDSPHLAGQPPIAGIPMCGSAPSTPPPSTYPGSQQAINWMMARQGSTAYDGYCLAAVYQAYLSGGVNITAGLPYGPSHDSAYTYWTVAKGRHPGDRTMPAGSLVFWRSVSSPTGPGHVGIAVTSGYNPLIVSTYDGRTRGIHTFHLNDYQQNLYLGYAVPA